MAWRSIVIAFQIAVLSTMGLLQYHATFDGLRQSFEYWDAWSIALAFGWMPIIGTGMAIYGAINSWSLPPQGAVAMFTWHFALFALIYRREFISGWLRWRFHNKKG